MQNVAVALKAADMAASAVAMLSRHPEFAAPLQRGLSLLNCALNTATTSLEPSPEETVTAAQVIRRREVTVATPEPEGSTSRDWEPDSVRDGKRCQALLLEILRRAMHDWVLYRQHTKLQYRELADDAYTWLFEEAPGHPNWRIRLTAEFEDNVELTGSRQLTSFLAICEALDLDPELVRTRVKEMNIRSIISAGRPAETRKIKPNEISSVEDAGLSIGLEIDVMPRHQEYMSYYESYGSVATPDMLSYNGSSNWY